jgi:mono/diheme cytochrome c family protein
MTMRNKFYLAGVIGLLVAGNLVFADADGSWLRRVPVQDHGKVNPLQGEKEAAVAGEFLFAEHCASCHGKNAEGKKKKPSLRSLRVQQAATDGDLHWLLVNGNMGKGMPSWAKLPDPQLWQLISYVKSLNN